MIHVFLYVLALQLSHALDLVKVDHEALFVRVTKFNALPAKYGFMVGAIKVLDTILMGIAELLSHLLLVFIIKIEIAVC